MDDIATSIEGVQALVCAPDGKKLQSEKDAEGKSRSHGRSCTTSAASQGQDMSCPLMKP